MANFAWDFLIVLAKFMVGFFATLFALNLIAWAFGQFVASVVAWIGIILGIVFMLTALGREAAPMSAEQSKALHEYFKTVKS